MRRGGSPAPKSGHDVAPQISINSESCKQTDQSVVVVFATVEQPFVYDAYAAAWWPGVRAGADRGGGGLTPGAGVVAARIEPIYLAETVVEPLLAEPANIIQK